MGRLRGRKWWRDRARAASDTAPADWCRVVFSNSWPCGPTTWLEHAPLWLWHILVNTTRTFMLRLYPRARSAQGLNLGLNLQHQLHGHQHRVVAADQPPLGEAAGVVDQRDVELRFQPASCARRDMPVRHGQLGRERVDAMTIRKARADGRADPAANFCPRNPMLAAEGLEAMRKILVGPQAQRKGAAGGVGAPRLARDRPEQLEIGLGVGLGLEHGALDAEGLDLERLGDDGLLRQDMAATHLAMRFEPQPMARKEWLAVALAERHGCLLEPDIAPGAKRLAVEGGVLSRVGQRRHHIGERAECPALDVEHAARKALGRKAAPCGFQQRNARFQREGEATAARFHPLDALCGRRPRLLDLAHGLPASARLLGYVEQPARLELVAHHAFWNLAVAGFRQGVPEEEALGHLVARHLWPEECRHLGLAQGLGPLAGHADGDADL